MSELTDLEICKRIAEIEGLEVDKDFTLNNEVFYLLSSAAQWMFDSFGLEKNCISFSFDPLTDKALCFDLMVEYELDLQAPYRPHNEVEWEVGYWIDGVSDAGFVRDKNPQRAICLAIIAKHSQLHDK